MPPKLDEKSETERVQLLVPSALMLRVDNWRRKQERVPNVSEALRKLIEAGLEARGESDKP